MKVSKAELIPFYEEKSIDSAFNLRFVQRKNPVHMDMNFWQL